MRTVFKIIATDIELLAGAPFALNDLAFPPNWLELASDDMLAAQGISKTTAPYDVVVPSTISDRQFFQQLAVVNIITPVEALDAVKTGEIPATLQALIDLMPEAQRFGAQMILSGATTFERYHPMTVAIGTSYGWTSQQLDEFFIAAAQL